MLQTPFCCFSFSCYPAGICFLNSELTLLDEDHTDKNCVPHPHSPASGRSQPTSNTTFSLSEEGCCCGGLWPLLSGLRGPVGTAWWGGLMRGDSLREHEHPGFLKPVAEAEKRDPSPLPSLIFPSLYHFFSSEGPWKGTWLRSTVMSPAKGVTPLRSWTRRGLKGKRRTSEKSVNSSLFIEMGDDFVT